MIILIIIIIIHISHLLTLILSTISVIMLTIHTTHRLSHANNIFTTRSRTQGEAKFRSFVSFEALLTRFMFCVRQFQECAEYTGARPIKFRVWCSRTWRTDKGRHAQRFRNTMIDLSFDYVSLCWRHVLDKRHREGRGFLQVLVFLTWGNEVHCYIHCLVYLYNIRTLTIFVVFIWLYIYLLLFSFSLFIFILNYFVKKLVHLLNYLFY